MRIRIPTYITAHEGSPVDGYFERGAETIPLTLRFDPHSVVAMPTSPIAKTGEPAALAARLGRIQAVVEMVGAVDNAVTPIQSAIDAGRGEPAEPASGDEFARSSIYKS